MLSTVLVQVVLQNWESGSCAGKRLDNDNRFPQVFKPNEYEMKLCTVATALEATSPLLDCRHL